MVRIRPGEPTLIFPFDCPLLFSSFVKSQARLDTQCSCSGAVTGPSSEPDYWNTNLHEGQDVMPRWSIAKRIAIIVGARIIPAIGFILTYIAFYPGLMSLDSDFQLVQARSFEFSDWHPVIMSLIWSGTNYVLPGPAGLFTLLLGIYWSAFFLVSEYFRNRSLTAYALALALPFLPLLINFSGTLWKDVLVFDCFIFSIGIVLYSCKDGFRHPSTVASIAAVMMIELGILARYNSQFAAVPLVALLFWSTTPVRGAEASAQVKSLLRSALAVAALFVLGTLILDLLLH